MRYIGTYTPLNGDKKYAKEIEASSYIEALSKAPQYSTDNVQFEVSVTSTDEQDMLKQLVDPPRPFDPHRAAQFVSMVCGTPFEPCYVWATEYLESLST